MPCGSSSAFIQTMSGLCCWTGSLSNWNTGRVIFWKLTRELWYSTEDLSCSNSEDTGLTLWCTVEHPLMATSLQRPFFGRQSIHWLLFEPLYSGHLSTKAFFWQTVHTLTLVWTSVQWPPLYKGLFLADSPYIDSCLNLSTTLATFIYPQGDRCGEVQLYFWKPRSHALVLS